MLHLCMLIEFLLSKLLLSPNTVTRQRSLDIGIEAKVFGTLDLKPRISVCALLYGLGDRIRVKSARC
jgi:hypothetical protein